MERHSSFLFYSSCIAWFCFCLASLAFTQNPANFFKNAYSTEYERCEPIIGKPGDRYSQMVLQDPGCIHTGKRHDRAPEKIPHPQALSRTRAPPLPGPTSPLPPSFALLTLAAGLSAAPSCLSTCTVTICLTHWFALFGAYRLPSSTNR